MNSRSDRTNLLFVTTSFPRFADDYAGRFVYEMARELSQHYPVRVLVPDSCDCDHRWSGVPVTPFQYMIPRRFQTLAYGAGIGSNLVRAPWRANQIPFLIRSMRKALDKHSDSSSILISHWLLPAGLAASAAARVKRIPHLAVAHGGDVHLLNTLPGGALLLRKILRGTDACIPVAEYQLNTLVDLAGEAAVSQTITRTIPMGIHLPDKAAQRCSSGRPNRWKDPKCFRILFLGRLIPLKGLGDLFTALAGISDMELHIAGDGPMRNHLEKRARESGIAARFHGMAGPVEKTKLFNRCDLMICPSRITDSGRTEGVPVSILEGLAHGCPVLASRAGGIPDIVCDGRNGWLVPPNDPTALRERIVFALSNHSARLEIARNGRETAHQHTWEKVGEAYLSVIQTVLEKRGR